MCIAGIAGRAGVVLACCCECRCVQRAGLWRVWRGWVWPCGNRNGGSRGMFFGRAAAAQRSRWQAVKQDKSTHTRQSEREKVDQRTMPRTTSLERAVVPGYERTASQDLDAGRCRVKARNAAAACLCVRRRGRAEFGVQQPNGCGLIGLIDREWAKIESKSTPGTSRVARSMPCLAPCLIADVPARCWGLRRPWHAGPR